MKNDNIAVTIGDVFAESYPYSISIKILQNCTRLDCLKEWSRITTKKDADQTVGTYLATIFTWGETKEGDLFWRKIHKSKMSKQLASDVIKRVREKRK